MHRSRSPVRPCHECQRAGATGRRKGCAGHPPHLLPGRHLRGGGQRAAAGRAARCRRCGGCSGQRRACLQDGGSAHVLQQRVHRLAHGDGVRRQLGLQLLQRLLLLLAFGARACGSMMNGSVNHGRTRRVSSGIAAPEPASVMGRSGTRASCDTAIDSRRAAAMDGSCWVLQVRARPYITDRPRTTRDCWHSSRPHGVAGLRASSTPTPWPALAALALRARSCPVCRAPSSAIEPPRRRLCPSNRARHAGHWQIGVPATAWRRAAAALRPAPPVRPPLVCGGRARIENPRAVNHAGASHLRAAAWRAARWRARCAAPPATP